MIWMKKSCIAERFGISRRSVDNYLGFIRKHEDRYPVETERRVLNRVVINLKVMEDAVKWRPEIQRGVAPRFKEGSKWQQKK